MRKLFKNKYYPINDLCSRMFLYCFGIYIFRDIKCKIKCERYKLEVKASRCPVYT